MENARDVSF